MVFLLWAVALGLILLLALIATPLHLRLTARVGSHNQAVLRASALGGLAPGVRLFDTDAPAKPKPPLDDSARSRGSISPRVARHIPSLLRGLLSQFSLVELRITGAVGLGDPADTGALFGTLAPAIYGPPPSERISVTVRPLFDRAHLEGELALAIRFVPILLAGPLIRFGLQVLKNRRPQ
ncbi:DUF2953 domain-containing protein [Arenibacterium sp. CAU 1754]